MGTPRSTAELRVPLSDIAVDDELVAAVTTTLRSGWWSMGPRVHELEEAFAALCGVDHALAVSNGTAALHLALLGLGCGPGDEVIVPSLTFVAAANTVVQTGASPVFADIAGPTDLNVDPGKLEALVSPRTRAIMVVHYGGYACDMDAVLELADRHGLAVVEDAAHAPGGTWNGRPCGGIGSVGCFSFFSNKNLPVGEGGMVVTANEQLASAMRLLRSHGMTTLTWDRHRGHAAAYDVLVSGLNYRLDDLRAAVGLVQLARLEQTNAARGAIVSEYSARLAAVEGLVVPFADRDPSESTHHLAVVLLPPEVPRGDVQERMREAGVQTSVHYPPIHRFTAFADLAARDRLQATEAVADRLLTLPLFAHMTDAQVELVVASLTRAVDAARAAPRGVRTPAGSQG